MRRGTRLLSLGTAAVFALACSGDSSEPGSAAGHAEEPVEEGVVPFEHVPVATPPAIAPGSPWHGVSIAIEPVPHAVEAGALLEFVVAITNVSTEPVDPQQTCPAYFMNFGDSSLSAEPVSSLLNCDAARPLPAGATQRFAMEIEIPLDLGLDLRLDVGSIYWRLEGVADASSDDIAVEPPA